ncbi:hypothetical protein TSAR_003864 [Trichomalopsis sarcophagae]|uniref:GH18 domain-containing protein n=1 Tax=Trichomalopsis sarcophagae TaxID=543379 RepID=A0A232F6F5_9HYME|nr:hypothetical protein TSAR_003864 [Trichomalopsis sarcophagae]
MVHKVLVPEADYTLLAGKQKFSCYNVVVVIVIFLLGFTSLGLLAYNFFKTAIAEEKLVHNVKVPSWMHWFWHHNATNSTAFGSTIKPIDEHFVVCYYTKRRDNSSSQLTPNNVDPHLCTHIIVGFASVVNCTLDLGEDLSIYREMVELKKFEPNLKIMVSVGGADNESGYPEMVLNHANRKTFIRSVLNATKTLNLDGLDLDWEFPAWAHKADRQKIHFVQLAYELRKEFDRSGQKLTLSAAVAAPQAIIDQSYIVPEFSEHVDFINLMSYDYHFYIWYYPVTDLNSPLYPRSLETGYLTSLNVNFSANYWVLKGMPREKIVIGIPLYGHSYKLYNPSNHKLQAPARGYGDTGHMGFVTYPEVCKFLKNGAVRVFVNDSHVPYTYKNNEWISYDDVTSVTYKATWIKSNGFKGAMVFSLNTDDWNSTCTPNHRFPLTSVVKKIFNSKPKLF